MTTLRFRAPGIPIGQAEVRPGNTTKTGKRTPSYYPNGRDLYPWRDTVAMHARVAAARLGWEKLGKHTPARLDLTFWLPRPPSVTRPLPSVPPDVQHLVRAIEDALTRSGVWTDDGQVTDGSQAKRYATAARPPGVLIAVRALTAAEIADLLLADQIAA